MDFVIVGPEKTGTSWIDAALRECASGSLPVVTKETFYLDRLYHLGARWHAKLYAGEAKPRGEVSPSYFARSIARVRLRGLNPTARVVIVLRDPYVRMASHLLHIMRRGAGNPRAHDLGLSKAQWSEARESSRYRVHGEAWRAALGPNQVKFVLYDDIKEAPAKLLREVMDHVGIDVPVDAEWASTFSERRVFEGAVPTSPGLAQMAYSMSRGLQALGATQLVAAARRSGLRRIVERRPDTRTNDLRVELEQRLLSSECFDVDIEYAEERLGLSLVHWRAASKLGMRATGAAFPMQAGL